MKNAHARPFQAGARVGGKYDLVRLLGLGGMGEVWMARNIATGGHVAVKRCRADIPGDEASERFRHEARLGAMLSHRGVVRVYDLVEQRESPPVLVMELLRGESLERALGRRGALPEREAIAVAVGVLAALVHAHERGILHRDVTPANIFLAVDPDGHVTPKLVDFGLAKQPASGVRTADGRVLGTPRYMAPERIRGGEPDARSDLFSVGVVLFEMLTGTSPFAASGPAASLAAVLEVTVDPDPRIAPRLWVEVQRALAKQPYERHPSAREFSDALVAVAGETEASLADGLRGTAAVEEPSLATSAPEWVKGSVSPARRSRIVAWIAVPTIALTAVAIGAALHRRPPPGPAAPTTASPGPQVTAVPPSPPPASAPAASAPPPAPAPVRPASRPARTRPIATTPGF